MPLITCHFSVIVACLVAMILIHFNLWHESSSPLFLPGLFVNVLAALLASGGAALTLKETINQVPVLVLNGVAATSLLLSFMGVIRIGFLMKSRDYRQFYRYLTS